MKRVDELLIQNMALRSQTYPPGPRFRAIYEWFRDTKKGHSAPESAYGDRRDDLTLISKPMSVLQRCLEQSSIMRFIQRKMDKRPHGATRDAVPSQFNMPCALIERTFSYLIIASGAFMLVFPMWMLVSVDGVWKKLGLITAFTLSTPLLSIAAVVRPFAILGAMIA